MAHDVFISYSSKNKTIADAMCATIEAKGVRCWIAPRDILPGREWSESIIDGIHECRIMVVVFSSYADASPQVRREAERAVSKGATILPFRIEDVYPSGAMEYYLSTSHWLDALDGPLEEHLNRLAQTVELLLSGAKTIDGVPLGVSTGAASGAVAPGAGAHGAGAHGAVAPGAVAPGAVAPGAGAMPAVAAGEATSRQNAPGTIVIEGASDLPAELKGFNWGAFLLNRSWLGAHNVHLGCLAGLLIVAPYLGLLLGAIYGFDSKFVLLLCAGALSWLLLGLKGNAWAWHNRRWINKDHFRKVQLNWLKRAAAFWTIVLVLGAVFMRSGMNQQAEKFTRPWIAQALNNPSFLKARREVKQLVDSKGKKISP